MQTAARALNDRAMATAKEYREYADECMGWAKNARSDRERAIFVQMANTWLQAAVVWETRHENPSAEAICDEQAI